MAAKDTFKHWLTLIDAALRKHQTRRLPPDASPPSPQGDASPTPPEKSCAPEAFSPLLTEDLTVDNTEHTAFLNAIAALSRQPSVPIDIYTDIYALMSPTDIQITSPHAIEPALLQPFATGAREVTLVFLSTTKIVPATIHMLRYKHLVVDIAHATLSHKSGERLLILFPALPDKRYVLQAVVDAMYPGRLKLRYQDPRYDVRRQFPLLTPVLLRLVPPTIVTAIAQERARLIRDIYVSPCATPAAPKSSIADRLYHMDTAIVSPHMQVLEHVPPISCDLCDISPGGVCLTFPEGHRPEQLLQRVTRLDILLPPLSQDPSHTQYFPFGLEPFGVIRNVKTTSRPWQLHIRFLKRLPPECDVLFEYVAQQHEAQHTL